MRSVAYSPDGTQLASGSDDWTVKLWEDRVANATITLTGRHLHPVAASVPCRCPKKPQSPKLVASILEGAWNMARLELLAACIGIRAFEAWEYRLVPPRQATWSLSGGTCRHGCPCCADPLSLAPVGMQPEANTARTLTPP